MVTRLYLACTGAGAGAQQDIWRVPGCSSYFAGACFPYGHDQLDEFLGFRPEQSCSPETALHMAMAAYQRAWLPGCRDAIGVGLTASVASIREHRGQHRIHAAIVSERGIHAVDQLLLKGTGVAARHRDGQAADDIATELATQALQGWFPADSLDRTGVARRLFFERPVWTETGARLPVAELGSCTLFPGAFNPPHAGHFGAADASGERVAFMITGSPPHKPALTVPELLQRAKLLRGHRMLFTEGDALYIEKARRFPGRPIVIGADALLRMMDPAWGPEPLPMVAEFAQLGTTLLVIGREIDGRFMTAHDVLDRCGVPPDLRSGFRDVPGRWDVSSTDLRATA